MSKQLTVVVSLLVLLTAFQFLESTPRALQRPTSEQPVVVDLATDAGVLTVRGQWRYSDVRILEISSAPTDEWVAKRRPNEPKIPERTTYDIEPHAGGATFDDSAWQVIPPTTLGYFRSGGQLCFGWYRIRLTIPPTVGDVQVAGRKASLIIDSDDYGEIWVNGELPRKVGSPNPNLISGWNMPTRLVLSDHVKGGETFQIAIFAINGPISDSPTNRVWIREAKLEFAR